MATDAEYQQKIKEYGWPELDELWSQIIAGETPGWDAGKAFMSVAYLVTEGDVDGLILGKLLPEQVKAGYKWVTAQGRYSAYSRASSMLVKYRKPVALVIDSNTTDPSSIDEQRGSLEFILRQAGSGAPYKLLLAVPEVEVLLTPTAELTSKISGRPISDFEFQFIHTNPKQFFKAIAPNPERYVEFLTRILSNITDDLLPEFQNQELIREISEFLETATIKSR